MKRTVFFVVVKSAHFETLQGYQIKRHKWRVVMADARHDKGMTDYLLLESQSDRLPSIRVLNPYRFTDFTISWVIAQLAIHIPEVALAEYQAVVVKRGLTIARHSENMVAKWSIEEPVYDWQGCRVKIENEENALW